MKRKRTTVNDLSFDLLSHITHCVASSSDGASCMIVLSSVCRVFKEISNDRTILKNVKFDDLLLPGLHESFWHRSGLLCQCMQNRNHSAIDFSLKYADALDLSFKVHRRALLLGLVSLLACVRAVDTVNTRSRQKALNVAEAEYQKICDAADVDIKRGKEFVEMLKAVIK
ncbi:hypothetical protein Leryth_005889 [Lithospermum erythrorhizon]|uniref:Uncharacterized protein n=1 Tax=Lithospermum erythrorhizon TaxID=34254 RepID=A0AAV3P0J8_LITER|nr:hypothetical protein Leryth_005889 [Lithospermum erythrorhizon]